MNRDDVVRLAREAHHKLVTIDYPGHRGQLDAWTLALMERFAQAIEQHLIASGLVEQAVRDEREACAKVCDAEAQVLPYPIGSKSAEICAELIRSRMFPNTTIHALA